MQLLIFIFGFLLFITLILIHEWGHYYAARRKGVVVEEFGLGLPPRAASRKTKGGMLLSLNWLPLGGFVKLKGEHDADTQAGSFGRASLGAKTQILLAGVTMNLLFALLLFTVLAWIGMPRLIDNQYTVASDTKVVRQELRMSFIDDNSPASAAGLQPRDSVTSITLADGKQTQTISSLSELRKVTKEWAGQSVIINGARKDGQAFTSDAVQLRTTDEVEASRNSGNVKGYLGVVPTELVVRRSTWSAPVVAVGLTAQLSQLTFKALGTALSGLGSTIAGLVTGNTEARQKGQTQATEQTGGIVAIVKIIWESGSLGFVFMLIIIAVVSLTLAIMNVLPIPALDGGRLFVTLLFRGLRQPLTRSLEERIHGTGMAVLLTLFVIITIVDVRRFF